MLSLSLTTRSMRIRLIGWLLVVLLLCSGLIITLIKGFSINTNILDLLPKSAYSPVVQKASTQFANTMGRQVVFLISNPQKQVAEKASHYFYTHLTTSHLFSSLTYKIAKNEQQAWVTFYFPHRLALLSASVKEALLHNNIKQIEDIALFKLYSPVGISTSGLLETDPYYLFQDYISTMPKPASNLMLSNQQMMTHANNRWYVMIRGQLKDNSFSLTNQTKISQRLNHSIERTLHHFKHTQFLKTGMIFYATAGAASAQQDISTIGIGSIIGIIALILLTFRSLTPLCYTLLSCAVGFLAAFVMTALLFGHVYLFTIIFGASLIGICVDYAFFYYADRLQGGSAWIPAIGLKHIFPGISLALLNVVLAYIVIAFTPFPGLKQLAVFSVSGLLMAFATVVCVFPYLLKPAKQFATPPLMRLTSAYLSYWKTPSLKKIMLLFTLLALFSISGIAMLRANDNIRILEIMPKPLQHDEQQIKSIIGSHIGTDFIIVRGDTPQHTLEHDNQLTQALSTKFPSIKHPFIAISTYLPTIKDQYQNYHLIKSKLLNKNLITYLEKIGVERNKALQSQHTLDQIHFTPLTLTDWVQSPVSQSLRYLWLGQVDTDYVSIILLSNQIKGPALKSIVSRFGFATYINKADDISYIFKTYRIRISWLLLVAYAMLFCILVWRYSLRNAIFYIVPPLAALAISLGVLGWFHIPLTLFNVLALILVLGIGIDYILFFAETRTNYYSTMLAVSLSAITMALSFGLLALSHTPVIHYFGITVLVGIISAYLLSPLAIRVSTRGIT